MNIGTHHRNKIWRSLVEFLHLQSTQTQQMQRASSNASTVSLPSQNSQGYCPGFYEVTRYTFKHTISVKKGDHDYCQTDG